MAIHVYIHRTQDTYDAPQDILVKLAALYNHPTTPQGEASAARARAKEIMAKYGLSEPPNIYSGVKSKPEAKKEEPIVEQALSFYRELKRMDEGQLNNQLIKYAHIPIRQAFKEAKSGKVHMIDLILKARYGAAVWEKVMNG